MRVLALCLRVKLPQRDWWLDLPLLESIQLGWNAFSFNEDDESSELIMRSHYAKMSWWIDLPALTSFTTDIHGESFSNPRRVTLQSSASQSLWSLDMPNLVNVTMNYKAIFSQTENKQFSSIHLSLHFPIDIGDLAYSIECTCFFTPNPSIPIPILIHQWVQP